MKLSLNWLKEYIDPKLPTEKLIDRLTMAGFEVGALEAAGKDTVLDIEITPNRPDCLSILGLAREIGAMTSKAVRYPKIKTYQTVSRRDLVQIENTKDCGRYIAVLITGLCIAEAPSEMKQYLSAVGLKSIHNAVDITNFVMMEGGQPLHAFDYDTLAGGRIMVRRARAGERLITLDGVERVLDPSILVIADAEKPVAIAGIMGGLHSQITPQTKNILLESAHFDMGLIRRASQSLGLRSDSSYRFERRVDMEGVLAASLRAVDLLHQMTGGKISGRQEIKARQARSARPMTIKTAEIESLLGMSLSLAKIKAWLIRLGFKVKTGSSTLTVTAPSHRADIRQAVDVVEEIARMVGFDRIPCRLPTVKSINIPHDSRPRQVKDTIRRVLTAGGLDEAITLSMISGKDLDRIRKQDRKALKIFNPLSQEQELMRPILLPSLLQVALTNINRGQKDLRFFELGKRYLPDGEQEALGILLTGRRGQDWRSNKKENVDFYDLKGIVERLFGALSAEVIFETLSMPTFEYAASVIMKGAPIGLLGKVAPEVLRDWEIKHQDIYYAGLDLDGVLALPAKHQKYQPVSEYPAIVRDVSLAVDKDTAWKQVEDICRAQGQGILNAVHLIEQYAGEKVQPSQKAFVFSCQYQSQERTLREDEAAAVHARLLDALTRELKATRR